MLMTDLCTYLSTWKLQQWLEMGIKMESGIALQEEKATIIINDY